MNTRELNLFAKRISIDCHRISQNSNSFASIPFTVIETQDCNHSPLVSQVRIINGIQSTHVYVLIRSPESGSASIQEVTMNQNLTLSDGFISLDMLSHQDQEIILSLFPQFSS